MHRCHRSTLACGLTYPMADGRQIHPNLIVWLLLHQLKNRSMSEGPFSDARIFLQSVVEV